MAFFITAQLLLKQLLKTEVIMNKVFQTSLPVINAADKYIHELKSLDIKPQDLNASEFLNFPLKTFYKFPKVSMESIIKESFDILSERGLVTTDLYENLINAYIKYGIDVNANDIFENMSTNGVQINKNIYSYLIRIFSLNGHMEDAERILDEMRSKGIEPVDTDKFSMVTGYIISGHPEKSDIFIKNNDLNQNKSKLSFAKCYAYAATNDSNKLLNILTEIEQQGITFYATDYFRLYRRLIESNISQSALDEIIDLTKKNISQSSAELFGTVARLNSADYFHQSIFLIYKFLPMVDDSVVFAELFTYSSCPIDIFKKALILLIKCDGMVRINTNIFSRMDIDSSLVVSQQFAKAKNWKIIYYSLINRAADEKSPEVLQKVLEFCVKNAGWRHFNDVLFSVFFDAVQRTGMITDYEDIFDLLPRFKQVLLRVLLMKYLCSGDYVRYNGLRLKDENAKEITIAFSWKFLANNIRTNLNLAQIKEWSEEAQKCFTWEVVGHMLSYLFYDEVISLTKSESLENLDYVIGFLKEWNLQLAPSDIRPMLEIIPKHHQVTVESSILKAINKIDREGTPRKD